MIDKNSVIGMIDTELKDLDKEAFCDVVAISRLKIIRRKVKNAK